MIEASKVSCVIVTRGNVDLAEIRASLPFEDIVIRDNSQAQQDEKVFGRYLAAGRALHDVIAVQDDDAIIEDWPRLLADYEPGVVTCNMCAAHRDYYAPMNLALVGFGAVFDKNLITPALGRYFAKHPKVDDLFLRECDRVFTAMNRLKVVSVPYRNLAYEQTTSRMWRESRHGADLQEIRSRIASL